jgi:hypothetical protein
MSDDRRFRLDIAAFVLLGVGLLVALCVLGNEAQPGGPVHPRPEPSNPLGPPGAWLAQSLYDALGVTVYLLLASWFVHVLVNVGMTLNLMPITGIPLPFFSYGGSFMLASWLAIGILVRIAAEGRGGRTGPFAI